MITPAKRSLDDIDDEEDFLNENFVLYFNTLSVNAENKYKQAHYNYMIRLLTETGEKIDSIQKYKNMLKEGGYRNPRGLLDHYMKFLGFVKDTTTGRLTMTI